MHRLASTLALALMIPLAGCDSGGPTEPDADVGGTYTLETVNGQPLPFLLQQAGEDRLEVWSGYIRLDTDGRFEDNLTLRLVEDGEAEEIPEVLEGNWAVSGSSVTMTLDLGGAFTAQVQGDALTQVFNEFTLVYRR